MWPRRFAVELEITTPDQHSSGVVLSPLTIELATIATRKTSRLFALARRLAQR